MKKDSNVSVPSQHQSMISVNQMDVICGRGKAGFNHPGNVRFRHAVVHATSKYINAEDRSEKPVIVHEIITNVYKTGGRFLRRALHERDTWVELNFQEQKDKVRHAIRDAIAESKVRKIKSSQCIQEQMSKKVTIPTTSMPLQHNVTNAVDINRCIEQLSKANSAIFHTISPATTHGSSLSVMTSDRSTEQKQQQGMEVSRNNFSWDTLLPTTTSSNTLTNNSCDYTNSASINVNPNDALQLAMQLEIMRIKRSNLNHLIALQLQHERMNGTTTATTTTTNTTSGNVYPSLSQVLGWQTK